MFEVEVRIIWSGIDVNVNYCIRSELLGEVHKGRQVEKTKAPSIFASGYLREEVNFFLVDSEGQEAVAHLCFS